ncbi:hypothetical protein L0P46_10845, partial [Collinsella aerofaciens]|nr:hypothetical protein [Collinsella aerofaciens]
PDLTFELDVFEGAYQGLILAEVEFASEEDAVAFTPPEWCARDVTWSGEYQNSRLAMEKGGGPGVRLIKKAAEAFSGKQACQDG